MAWCFNDEITPYTENLLERLGNLEDSAVVPTLWLYEVTNVARLAARKGRITEAKADLFLESLIALPIEVEPAPTRVEIFSSLSTLMGKHKLTSYDAAYLELAVRRRLPLATLDIELREACRALDHPMV